MRFLGVQPIPDGDDAVIPATDGEDVQRDGSPGVASGAPQLPASPASEDDQGQEVAIGSPVQEPPGVAPGVDDAAPPGGWAEARGRLPGGDGVIPPRRSSRNMDRPRSYRDKRAWQRRALLARYVARPVSPLVHLKEGPDIEGASQELSEEQ